MSDLKDRAEALNGVILTYSYRKGDGSVGVVTEYFKRERIYPVRDAGYYAGDAQRGNNTVTMEWNPPFEKEES